MGTAMKTFFSGNTAGQIGVFENLGAADGGVAKWGAPKLLEVDGKPLSKDNMEKTFRYADFN